MKGMAVTPSLIKSNLSDIVIPQTDDLCSPPLFLHNSSARNEKVSFLQLVYVSGRHSGTDQIFHRSLLLIITKRHYKKLMEVVKKKKPEQE